MRPAGRWLLRAVQLAAVVVLGWALWRRLAPELAQLKPEDLTRWRPAMLPLLLSFGLLVVVYLLNAFLWRRILRDISGREASPRATVKIYFLSGLGRYVPGKVWLVASMVYLAGKEDVPPLAATASAVLGQIGFLTTGLLFLALTLPSYGGLGSAILAALAALAALVAGIFFLSASGPGARLRHLVAHHVGERAARAFEIFDRIRPRTALVWGLGYLLAWALLGLAFATFVAAFVPVTTRELRLLGGTVAASYLAGYLFLVAPAGIGVREGVMTALLSGVMPAPAALVVAVVSRIWFTAAEILPLALLPVLPAARGRGGDGDGGPGDGGQEPWQPPTSEAEGRAPDAAGARRGPVVPRDPVDRNGANDPRESGAPERTGGSGDGATRRDGAAVRTGRGWPEGREA